MAKERKRSARIELLRILAMLMVLGLHADFMALGVPAVDDILSSGGITRVVIQSMCIVAVNVFVMISGWFGIKSSLKGFCNFMWQVIYFVGLLLLAGVVLYDVIPDWKSCMGIFGLYNGGGWFVASYIGLYIIAPALNYCIEHMPVRRMAVMLAAFFAFEFFWGNTLSVGFVIGGYSTFSFIGIYMLSGMLRKAGNKYGSPALCFAVFLLCTLSNSLFFILSVRYNAVMLSDMVLNYINPLVIVGAASLLLFFARFRTPECLAGSSALRKIVLFCAASCFAAYLMHVGSPKALELYCSYARCIFVNTEGPATLMLLVGYVFIVFMIAVVADQPRKLIWNKLLLPLFR